jgi:hypothetical protein
MQLDSTAKMKFNKIKRLIYSIISLIKSRITMFHFGSKCGTHTVQSTECCLPTAYSQRREPKEEVWPFSVIRWEWDCDDDIDERETNFETQFLFF